jgi:hypothetical protein
MSDGRGHTMVPVAVRPAAGADAAVEQSMGTRTVQVQTNTDVENLIVKTMRIINAVYTRQGDTGVDMKDVTIRKITATDTEVVVIFHHVGKMTDVGTFTVTDYVTPSWHDIQEQIAISI